MLGINILLTICIFYALDANSWNLNFKNRLNSMKNVFQNDFLKNTCRLIAVSTVIASTLVPSPSNALINQLADVGVKEFLVKDGSQLLRLSLPSGKDMKFGAESVNEFGRIAQESIELIRLRCE